MARPALTVQQKNKIKRGIRQAASELYLEKGLAKITIRGIAERAGVSTGMIYLHFENLSELMRSLWRRPFTQFEDKLKNVSETEKDPVKRLEQILMLYVAFAHRQADVYRAIMLYVRPSAHEKPKKEPLTTVVFFNQLVLTLKEGQKSKVFIAGDATEQAEILWASVHGAIAMQHNFDRLKFSTSKTLTRNMVKALMASLKF